MGLLSFLFYRKKKEEDLPLIARVKFRTKEEQDKYLEDYINNNDVPLLGVRKYKPISEEDNKKKNDSKEREL